jgi:hypothetical protein
MKKKQRAVAEEAERVVAYRLRDRDLTQLLVIERCSRLMLNGVLEIISRMRMGEHPSTEEELELDRQGHWTIERFLREWGIYQKNFFEQKGGKA